MNAIFKALNDETRRDILELLRKQEMTAGDIADQFHISKPSISSFGYFKTCRFSYERKKMSNL